MKHEITPQLFTYLRHAYDAGCPVDQMRNFLRAQVVLQPAQLAASAALSLEAPWDHQNTHGKWYS